MPENYASGYNDPDVTQKKGEGAGEKKRKSCLLRF